MYIIYFCLTGWADLFFNQKKVNFKLTARETLDTPILSAILYIDKNIANKTEFGLDMMGPWFISKNVASYFRTDHHSTPKIRLQVNKFNGSRYLDFNVSGDSSECSAGERTFVMVPVKVYALSIVGLFQITIDPHKARHYEDYPGVTAIGLVDSGKDNYSSVT